jgi:hypothetical protein
MWRKQRINYLSKDLRLNLSLYSSLENDSTKCSVETTPVIARIVALTPFVIILDLIRFNKAVVCGIPFIPLITNADPKLTVEILEFKIKIEVRHKEHAPPHFHVLIDDCDYSLSIETGEFLHAPKIKKRDNEAIKEWYKSNRELLIKIWNDSRPSDCPVGKIK